MNQLNHNLDKKDTIKKLENLASEILKLKKGELRRPLLIEFCGSPKAGKSTTVTALNIFLKRNGFKTVVLTERASVCPIKKKTHPFFNIWTLTSAVSEIVEHLDQGKDKVDIIISDRGIFDAFCWFKWLNTNPSLDSPHLGDKSYKDLEHFILMDIWRDYLDLIYVFQVKPETSIIREYANLLTDKRGSIMTESVLAGFNCAIEDVINTYQSKFRCVKKISTDIAEFNEDPNRVSYRVTSEVLDTLKDLLIEKIGYFNTDNFGKIEKGVNPISIIQDLKIVFDNRDKVENQNFIQPVIIAVITNQTRNKVLVVKKSLKRTTSTSPESKKTLLYVGGHVRQEDEKGETLTTIKKTLHREIQEEIGESIEIKDIHPFIIYTPDDHPKSKKHLAICYVVEMDLDDKRFKLTSDEFTPKTGTSESGRVLEVKEILTGNYPLESWSKQILKKVFKADISKIKDLFDTD